jgi:cell volume regulation protein A
MLEITISAIGLTILLGFFGNVLFQRTTIPNTLWLLLFGMILGAIGFVGKDFISDAAGLIGAIAVIGILSDGGLHLDLKRILLDGILGTLLMVSGLVVSTIGIVLLLSAIQIPLEIAVLIAVTLAGTSASVVIPTITPLTFISDKLKAILSIESISDTFSIVIALFLIDYINTHSLVENAANGILQGAALQTLSAMSIGIIFGLLWGPFIGKLKKYEYSYAATLGALIMLYAVSELFGSSGAIAVFFAGIMLANAHLLYRTLFPEFNFERLDEDISKTHSLIAFLIRVFFFVFLGIVVGIPEIKYLIIGLLVTGVIILGRVLYINLFSKYHIIPLTENEKHLTFFMIPRGLSAAVLSIFAFSSGIAYGEEIVNIIFSVIIFSILITTFGTYIMRKKMEGKKDERTTDKTPFRKKTTA